MAEVCLFLHELHPNATDIFDYAVLHVPPGIDDKTSSNIA